MQGSGYIPESWIGQYVRVEYKGNHYESVESPYKVLSIEGHLTGTTNLGILIDDHNLIAYDAIMHVHPATRPRQPREI